MSKNQKQRTKHGAVRLLEQARRGLEKGNFKEALKDAKVCYRQQPDGESRQVLERAYLARLASCAAPDFASSPAMLSRVCWIWAQRTPRCNKNCRKLLIAVGLFDRAGVSGGANPLLDEQSPWFLAAADHAVLRPELAPAKFPAIGQGAGTIRQALAAVEAGDEPLATAVLRDVPRASPFADWKYFVRGLAAYYRQDAAETQANWDRLDSTRFAARIAATLKALADPAAAALDDARMADALHRLGSGVARFAVLKRLQRLQEQAVAGRWREAVKLLRSSQPLFLEADPALPQRLTMVLCAGIIQRGETGEVRELIKVAEPLPIDPQWNRALAMAHEHSREYDLAEVEHFWWAYITDLAGVECLSSAERTLAQALVWLRLGDLQVEESSPLCASCHLRHDPDEELQARAVKSFENSLKLAPELLAAYQQLAAAYAEWDDPDQSAAVHQRLVERFPENLDSLLFLATHYTKRNEPFTAREFVFRAQRLRPLDPKIKALARTVHIASARAHATARRWDDGRAELAAAEKLHDPGEKVHHVLVCGAALEFKAGEYGMAHRLLDRAKRAGRDGPGMVSDGHRGHLYALPKTVSGEFENRWLTALKKGRRSAVAGEMCQALLPHPTDRRELCGPLGARGTAFGFSPPLFADPMGGPRPPSRLRTADPHSGSQGRAGGTAIEAVRVGEGRPFASGSCGQSLRQVPRERLLPVRGRRNAVRQRLPGWRPAVCREHFERALELAKGTSDPDDTAWVKRARERLDFIEENGPVFLAGVCVRRRRGRVRRRG